MQLHETVAKSPMTTLLVPVTCHLREPVFVIPVRNTLVIPWDGVLRILATLRIWKAGLGRQAEL